MNERNQLYIVLGFGIMVFAIAIAIFGPGNVVQSISATAPVTVSSGSNPTVSLDLLSSNQSGSATSNNSGMDVVNSELSLLRCLNDAEYLSILSGEWTCTTLTGVGAGGSFVTQLGDITIVSTTTVIDFSDSYFTVTESPSFEAKITAVILSDAATALAADPADCAADTKADAIAVNGDLTCTAVDTGDVTDDSLLEADLDATDTPTDEDILTYESGAGGDFEWHTLSELGALTSYARMASHVVCAVNAVDTTNCDSVADGTADEIQINAALSTNRWVHLSDGGFSTADTINIPSNIKLTGSGVNVTIITLANNSDVHVVENADTTGGNSYIEISNITFDFNGANQTGDFHGIRLQRISDFWLHDAELKNAFHHNILTVAPVSGLNANILISNVTSSGAGQGAGIDGDGFRFEDGMTSAQDAAYFVNVEAYDNSHHGIHIGLGSRVTNATADNNATSNYYLDGDFAALSNCVGTNPGTHNVVITSGSTNGLISNCYFDTSGTSGSDVIRFEGLNEGSIASGNTITDSLRHGIRTDSDDVVIDGNYILGADNDGVIIVASDGVTVTDNFIDGANYGIEITATSNNLVIATNNILNSVTRAIQDLGSTGNIFGNLNSTVERIASFDCTGNSNGGVLTADALGVITCDNDDSGGGGSAIIFDIGDDGGNDSIDVSEIATTGDTNTIFTMPLADKILIAVGNNWPTADTADALSANPADCPANQFADVIAANGTLSCNGVVDADVVDALTIAGGTIGASAITLVQGVNPTPTAEGVIEWETDDDHIIVGDGSSAVEFVPAEDVSGDITMTDAGVTTIQANAVALTTDTTGNYTASIADAGNTTVTVVNGSTEGGAVTLDVIDVNCSNCLTTTEVSGIDVSDDVNLTAGRSLTLTGDDVLADVELYETIAHGMIETPTTADDAMIQWKFAHDITIARISCSTDAGTVTIQLDERAEATPNSAGTDVMTSALVCDTNNQATTSFANATIAADAPLSLDIDAVATATLVRIFIDGTIDD